MALRTLVNGDRIRQARLGAGMSQAQLARAIGSTEKNISRWEQGRNQPRITSAAAIAAATGHDLEFFLTGSDEDEDEEAALDSMADLVHALRQLVRAEVAAGRLIQSEHKEVSA